MNIKYAACKIVYILCLLTIRYETKFLQCTKKLITVSNIYCTEPQMKKKNKTKTNIAQKQ